MSSIPEKAVSFRERPMPPALFDGLARAAVIRMGVPKFCRVRRCARHGDCMGKRKTCELPLELTGNHPFEVLLPTCIANFDDLWFREFLMTWLICRQDHFGHPIRPPEAVCDLLALREHWPSAEQSRKADLLAP